MLVAPRALRVRPLQDAEFVLHMMADLMSDHIGFGELPGALNLSFISWKKDRSRYALWSLQADCFAGVWAYHADRTKHIIEQGDVEAALNAASAVGDDRLQRQAQRAVVR
jgi:hypothetical protein